MNDHAQLKQMLIENEGSISHMYLDTVGKVTVGVGHMICDTQAAQLLKFVLRGSVSAAVAQQIVDDFTSTCGQPKGQIASHYLACTKLDMSPAAIDDLLNADIASMEAGVRKNFPGYDTYPAPAQDALLDMAFNLGVQGLVTKFPHLRNAALAQDWTTCAAQCQRSGISDKRNETTKQLFLRAAAKAAAGG